MPRAKITNGSPWMFVNAPHMNEPYLSRWDYPSLLLPFGTDLFTCLIKRVMMPVIKHFEGTRVRCSKDPLWEWIVSQREEDLLILHERPRVTHSIWKVWGMHLYRVLFVECTRDHTRDRREIGSANEIDKTLEGTILFLSPSFLCISFPIICMLRT